MSLVPSTVCASRSQSCPTLDSPVRGRGPQEVGHDGKIPYEHLRGKQSRLLGLEFGKLLHFRRHQAAGKLDVSWVDGSFLGCTTLLEETIVRTSEGVMRTNTV